MQDKIVSTILRLTIFKLKNLLAYLFRNIPLHSADHNTLYILVLKESKQNKQLNSLLTVIYKHHEKRMEKDGIDQAKIKYLVGLELKAIIGQLINEKCQLIKRQTSKIEEQPNQDYSAQLHVKNKDSTSVQVVANKPWPDEDQSSIQEPEQAQSQEEESCFEQSKNQGHFLLGDKAQQIEQIFSVENELYGLVKWQPRWGGETPRSSVLHIASIKEHTPRFLCDFLEEFMRKLNR